jgi:hypothetical protein
LGTKKKRAAAIAATTTTAPITIPATAPALIGVEGPRARLTWMLQVQTGP